MPFADYDSFEDCVAQNQDKDSPEGFCAWLHYQTTGQWPGEKSEVNKMQFKSINFEIKALDDETWKFEGIASAFRKSPDKVSDIVDPGAFTKTIKDNSGEVMLTFPPHDISSPIGKGVIEEAEKGLQIKGTLIKGIQKAEEAYLLLKAGVIKHMSIGYDAIKWNMDGKVRHLTEVALYEVGLVPGKMAVDDQAKITSVKAEFESRLDELEEELKSGRVMSKVDKTKLKNAIAALQELLEAARTDDDDDDDDDDKGTSKSQELDSEMIRLEAISARLSGFDMKSAEKRIDELLARMKG